MDGLGNLKSPSLYSWDTIQSGIEEDIVGLKIEVYYCNLTPEVSYAKLAILPLQKNYQKKRNIKQMGAGMTRTSLIYKFQSIVPREC